MGKFLKGIALLAASAVGTYYYKNPKELEKHKDVLKENIDLGLEKVNDLIKPEAQEVNREGEDIAKEKLEQVTAGYNEVKEETFIPLKEDAEEKVEEAKEVAHEKVEDAKEVAEEKAEEFEEKVEEAKEAAQEKVEEAKEVAEEKAEDF